MPGVYTDVRAYREWIAQQLLVSDGTHFSKTYHPVANICKCIQLSMFLYTQSIVLWPCHEALGIDHTSDNACII